MYFAPYVLAWKQSDIVLGTEYQIVTLSFDPGETFDLAARKKATYKKINSSDDYHYIQISQPTDTLTLQEYGTITFNSKLGEGTEFIVSFPITK